MEPTPGRPVKGVERDPGRVLVKVCGLTTPADARLVVNSGADWIGLNFHPPSPRYVDEAGAGAILAVLGDASGVVGLFVNRPAAEVAALSGRLGLRIVQLHGDEPPDEVAALKDAGLFVLRAFRLKDAQTVESVEFYLEQCDRIGAPLDAVLVDAYVPGVPGGTGRTIAGDLLSALSPLPRLILAGGLTPENVAERVAAVRPWMVDVAGGVESAPGVKDPQRVAAFLQAVRSGEGA